MVEVKWMHIFSGNNEENVLFWSPRYEGYFSSIAYEENRCEKMDSVCQPTNRVDSSPLRLR